MVDSASPGLFSCTSFRLLLLVNTSSRVPRLWDAVIAILVERFHIHFGSRNRLPRKRRRILPTTHCTDAET